MGLFMSGSRRHLFGAMLEKRDILSGTGGGGDIAGVPISIAEVAFVHSGSEKAVPVPLRAMRGYGSCVDEVRCLDPIDIKPLAARAAGEDVSEPLADWGAVASDSC
jgi:hypothetical protein